MYIHIYVYIPARVSFTAAPRARDLAQDKGCHSKGGFLNNQ